MKFKIAWRRLLNGKIKFIWIINPVIAKDSKEPYKLKSGERWVTYKPNGDDAKGRHCVINGATGEITQGNPEIKGKNIDELPHKKHPIPEEKYQRWLARQEKKNNENSSFSKNQNNNKPATQIRTDKNSEFLNRLPGIPDNIKKIDCAEITGLELNGGIPCKVNMYRANDNELKEKGEDFSKHYLVYTLESEGDSLSPEKISSYNKDRLKEEGAQYDKESKKWIIKKEYNKSMSIEELAEYGAEFGFGYDIFSKSEGNTKTYKYSRDITKPKPPEPFSVIPGMPDNITTMQKTSWGVQVHHMSGKAVLYSAPTGENSLIINFNGFPPGDDRARLKRAGFKYNPEVKKWYKTGNDPKELYKDIYYAAFKVDKEEAGEKETYRRKEKT